ncbi:hypothetical protein LOK49_LG13G00853 [Camellia lanceoleosa]|uniref:Uncharacterized protein n=1 Tax=Camellia lanceoleosa TaxID=1840588 RepID=A0ACC0FEY6_9ERIC|nr:hypothetical protein LOK49_LG13G00853 [Camellia lanceoleosa]
MPHGLFEWDPHEPNCLNKNSYSLVTRDSPLVDTCTSLSLSLSSGSSPYFLLSPTSVLRRGLVKDRKKARSH